MEVKLLTNEVEQELKEKKLVFAQGQAINAVSFKSYPDNDFTKCIFVM